MNDQWHQVSISGLLIKSLTLRACENDAKVRTIKRTCLQLGLDGGQFTKSRGDHAEQEGSDNIGDKESTHSRDTDGAHQLVVEDDGI